MVSGVSLIDKNEYAAILNRLAEHCEKEGHKQWEYSRDRSELDHNCGMVEAFRWASKLVLGEKTEKELTRFWGEEEE